MLVQFPMKSRIRSEEYFEGWFPEQKDEEDRIYVDDITGVQLPTDKVLEARQEELQWIHRQKIYEKRTLDECWAVTGKAPITLKWIDRNKGDSLHPNFRSRLVVREVKKQHGAFASPHAILEYAAVRGGEDPMQFVGEQEDIEVRQAAKAGAIRHQSCSLLRWRVSDPCTLHFRKEMKAKASVCPVT